MSCSRLLRWFAVLTMLATVLVTGVGAVSADNSVPDHVNASGGGLIAPNAHTTFTKKASANVAGTASISPPTQTLPYTGTNKSVTITAIGSGGPFTVCQQVNNGPVQVFAQSPSGAAISQATVNSSGVGIIAQSASYSYTVVDGLQNPCNVSSGFLAQTILNQANPIGNVGFADVEAVFGQGGTPSNPAGSGPPVAPGVSCGGGFAASQFAGDSNTGNGGQGDNANCLSPGGQGGYKFFTVGSGTTLATYPRTFYIAFDAGSKVDGSQNPSVYLKAKTSQGGFTSKNTEGAIGIYKVANMDGSPWYLDGVTEFEAFDPPTNVPTSSLSTTLNVNFDEATVNNGKALGVPCGSAGGCVGTSQSSFAGGTNAVITFSAHLGAGDFFTFSAANTEQALACVYTGTGAPAAGGPFPAAYRTAAISSNGAISQNSISNLPVGTYTIAVYQLNFGAVPFGGNTVVSGNPTTCGGLNAFGLSAPNVIGSATLRGSTTFTITA